MQVDSLPTNYEGSPLNPRKCGTNRDLSTSSSHLDKSRRCSRQNICPHVCLLIYFLSAMSAPMSSIACEGLLFSLLLEVKKVPRAPQPARRRARQDQNPGSESGANTSLVTNPGRKRAWLLTSSVTLGSWVYLEESHSTPGTLKCHRCFVQCPARL